MPDSTQDAFHRKTTDELLFFTRNPSFYQPELVEAAFRELRLRGAISLPPPPPEAVAQEVSMPAENWAENQVLENNDFIEPASRPKRRGLWIAGGVWLLLGAGWLFYRPDASSSEAVKSTATADTASAKKTETPAAQPEDAPLELAVAPSSPLPNYDGAVTQCITAQLKKVPAREKTNLQTFRQYRELSHRFWAAQTLSEYITDKYQREPQNPVLAPQIEVTRNAWKEWNVAMRYGFKFPPVMADHLDRMQRVARQEQEYLEGIAGTLATDHPRDTSRDALRDADVQDLLSGLLPKSLVSQQPYRKSKRHVNM